MRHRRPLQRLATYDGRVEVGSDQRSVADAEDRRILEFMSVHQFVLAGQVAKLLGIGEQAAQSSLGRLAVAGLICRAPRLRHHRCAFQITSAGLSAVGSELAVPQLELRRYWKDLALPWIWLTARTTRCGIFERSFTRREIIAADQAQGQIELGSDVSEAVRAKAAAAQFAISVRRQDRRDAVELRYPDIVHVDDVGRVAMEIALTAPGGDELDAVLSGYRDKPDTGDVFFFAERYTVAQAIHNAAVRLGTREHVHVWPTARSRRAR